MEMGMTFNINRYDFIDVSFYSNSGEKSHPFDKHFHIKYDMNKNKSGEKHLVCHTHLVRQSLVYR